MRIGTAVVLLIWQVGKMWQIIDNIRFRRKRKEFWDRHEDNIKAVRSGLPQPYPNNSLDWPKVDSANAATPRKQGSDEGSAGI